MSEQIERATDLPGGLDGKSSGLEVSVLPANLSPEVRAGQMAREGATDDEIRTLLKLTDDQMKCFASILEYERAQRRTGLRRTQTELALAGSETLLRILGEFELEQSKRDQARAMESLPDLDRYPDYGYPPGDPRVLLMKANENVQANEIIHVARLVASYAKSNPTHTWLQCLIAIAELHGIEDFEQFTNPPNWQETLRRKSMGGAG